MTGLIHLPGYERSTNSVGNGSLPETLHNLLLSWESIPYTESSRKGWVERTEFRRGTTLSGRVISRRRVGRCYMTQVGDSTLILLLTKQTVYIPQHPWRIYPTGKGRSWVSGKPKSTQEFFICNRGFTGYVTWREIGKNLKPEEYRNSIWTLIKRTHHL